MEAKTKVLARVTGAEMVVPLVWRIAREEQGMAGRWAGTVRVRCTAREVSGRRVVRSEVRRRMLDVEMGRKGLGGEVSVMLEVKVRSCVGVRVDKLH